MLNKEIKNVTLPNSIYNFVTLAVTNSFDSTLFNTFKSLKQTVEQKANQILDTTSHSNSSPHSDTSASHSNAHLDNILHTNASSYHSNTRKDSNYHVNNGGVHTESGGGHSNSGGGHSNSWNSGHTKHTDAGLPHTDAGLKHTDLTTSHGNSIGHSQTGHSNVVPYSQSSAHSDNNGYTQNIPHYDSSYHSNSGYSHQNYVPSVSYVFNGKTNTELGSNSVLNKTVTIGMFAYDKNNDNAGTQDTLSKTVKYNLQIRKQGATSWTSLVSASTSETFDLDTTKYADGIYELKAWAMNDTKSQNGVTKNYTGQAKQITIEIRQNTLPTLSINNAGQIINFTFSAKEGKNKIPLTGAVYDADVGDLDTVYYRIDGSAGQPGEKYGNTITSDNTNQAYPDVASSIDVTGISEGTHTLNVWAQDSSGGKSAESTVSFKVDKSDPATNVPTLTAKSATEILIHTNSTDPVSNGISSGLGDTPFMYNRNDIGDFAKWNSDDYLDQELTPDTKYTYKYKVMDNASNCSDYSATASIYTLAAVPNINVVSPASYSLYVETSDNNPSYTKYQILCTDTVSGVARYVSSSGELLPAETASTDPATWIVLTSVSDIKKMIHVTGLESNKSYTFKAIVKNTDNVITSETSNSVTNQTLAAPPSTPEGLKIEANTPTSVTATSVILSWESVTEATGYEIAVDGDTGNPIATTSNSYTINGLLPGTLHTFSVRSVNGGNPSSSAWSQSITKYTLTDAPKNIKIERTSDSLNISWDTVTSTDNHDATGYDIFVDNGTSPVDNGTSPVDNGTSTTYEIQGLNPNSVHTYRVRARNSSGTGALSDKITVYTLANNPTDDKVIKATNTSISAQWESNENPENTQYCIAVFDKDGKLIKQNAWTVKLNDTVTGLEPDSTYILKIKARNGDNIESEWKVVSSEVKTIPNAPVIPTVQTEAVSSDSIQISWNGADGQVYDIRRDGKLIAENLTGSSIVDKDLAEDTTYKYSVEAKNAGGASGFSSEISQTTLPDVPGVPTGITSTADTTSIKLSWNPSEKATGYKIDNGTTQIDVGNVTSYTVENLEKDREYSFKIVPYNRGGDGNSSDTFSVFTHIDAPSEVTATATSSSIFISWTSVPECDHYEVFFNGNTYATTSTAITFDTLAPAATYQYKVRAVNDTTVSNWSQDRMKSTLSEKPVTPVDITTTSTKTTTQVMWGEVSGATSYDIMVDSQLVQGINGTSYTVTGLAPGSSHTYMVRARNSGGKSEWSDAVTEFTQAAQPNVPVNVTSECSTDSIAISWGAVANAESYEIEIDGVSQKADTNSYVHSELMPGESHTYRIRSLSQETESDWSDTYIFSTKLNNYGIPSNLTGNATGQSISLNWDAVEGALGYDIEVDGQIISTGSNIYYSADGLEGDTNHRFRVRTQNEGGAGEWSNGINISTLPAVLGVSDSLAAKAEETSIVLSWKPLENALSYDIEIDGSQISTVIGTIYKIEGLLPDTHHTYRIRAKNENQTGEWSGILDVQTLSDLPLTPENIKTSAARNSIKIEWDRVQTAKSYEIEIDGTTVKEIADTGYTDTDLNTNEQHSYRIRAINGDTYSEWSEPRTLSTLPERPETPEGFSATAANKGLVVKYSSADGATEYDIQIDGNTYDNGSLLVFEMNEAPGTQHSLRVRAKNAGGMSDWSKELTVLVPEDTPGVPEGITSDSGINSIETSWKPVAGAISYDIEVDGKVISLGNDTKYTDTGLLAGSLHKYRVRANNQGGNGVWSSIISKTTDLAAPQDITSDSSSGEIVLSWSTVEGIGEYELEIDGEVIGVTGTKYIQKDAQPNQKHAYRVRAKNSVTESVWSKSIEAELPMQVYSGEFKIDDEIPFELGVNNAADINNSRITLLYDPEQVELTDLCGLTGKLDMELGNIEDTNIKVLQLTPGKIVLMINDNEITGEYSGIIDTIMFKSKIDGQVSISFSIN